MGAGGSRDPYYPLFPHLRNRQFFNQLFGLLPNFFIFECARLATLFQPGKVRQGGIRVPIHLFHRPLSQFAFQRICFGFFQEVDLQLHPLLQMPILTPFFT